MMLSTITIIDDRCARILMLITIIRVYSRRISEKSIVVNFEISRVSSVEGLSVEH